jgi:hypothetical protein
MQPFVIMHGLDTGLLDQDALIAIRGAAAYGEAEFEATP